MWVFQSDVKLYTCGSSTVVHNAAVRFGENRRFCKLQYEGQSLMRAAISQLKLSARTSRREIANFGHDRL